MQGKFFGAAEGRIRGAAWAVIAATVLASACGEPSKPRNVVLVVLDTVRADHLSCYGYGRRTTPNLDRFAASADRYVTARSTAPWTLPSHASLFTGKFPHRHGADALKLPSGAVADAIALSDDEVTLAEALAEAGFATGAFVANRGYVNPRLGLAQGFETFVNERYEARRMSELAAEWASGVDASKPWFLFVNYMDAHRPYNVAPLPPERAAELPEPPGADEPNAVESLDALCQHVFLRDDDPPPALVQRVIDNYDLGLANLDLGLATLFEQLRASGVLDDALVVITADHGEYFGEHDLVEHSKDVYEPALRVPLIVKRPGQREGRVIDEPISLVDVPGLILREAAPEVARAHPERFRGAAESAGALAQVKYARQKDLDAPYGQRFRRERDALYVSRYKLIRSSDGRHELFDLAADPGERRNLFSERPAEAKVLMTQLERMLSAAGPARVRLPSEMSEEERRIMSELGYTDFTADGVGGEPREVEADGAGRKPEQR